MHSASKNFGLFREAMTEMASTLGHLGSKFGQLLGSKGFGKTFHAVAEENQLVVVRLGKSLIHLFAAFMRVLVVARPLTNWLFKSVNAWSHMQAQTIKTAEGQRRLARFFRHTKQAIELIVNVSKNFIGALVNVGAAG